MAAQRGPRRVLTGVLMSRYQTPRPKNSGRMDFSDIPWWVWLIGFILLVAWSQISP